MSAGGLGRPYGGVDGLTLGFGGGYGGGWYTGCADGA
jgi:hypothetical protein